ncbi:hypothetical protein DBR32_14525 [Taibaiella sp. KBW10]|uniref:DUF6252 family protein n=1 Tax=Taibaiella sp. KBW10 TaxID=2153357 RepID=UPI000F5B3CBD|nr:DUF6252 family protein [Taibaiella sp. KBW10]RQO29796.1 hypothetical protein DBR32_14525 [Taibaiella sp. KBW10]
MKRQTSVGLYKSPTLGARSRSDSALKYVIHGSNKNSFFSSPGAVQLQFPVSGIPAKDTFMIDGVNATASIWYFGQRGDTYFAKGGNQGSGKIIFSKRNPKRLEGTFEFTAINRVDSSVITITNGKFSIVPTP